MEAIRPSEFKRTSAEIDIVTSQKRVTAVNIGNPTYFIILINIFMKYFMKIEGIIFVL
jgi:arginine/lysine/ornithine decarboxylase